MATLVIRNVDSETHERLKAQAAAHRRSMEEELRVLIRNGLEVTPLDPSVGLGTAIQALFAPLGGFELTERLNDPPRDPPDFSGPEWDHLD